MEAWGCTVRQIGSWQEEFQGQVSKNKHYIPHNVITR